MPVPFVKICCIADIDEAHLAIGAGASAIGPGPLGIADTSPMADAPAAIASRASSRSAMQQTFTNM